MKYIKLNLNEEYIDRERENVEKCLLKLFIVSSAVGLIIFGAWYYKYHYLYTLQILEIKKRNKEQIMEIEKLNKEVKEIIGKQKKISEEMEEKQETLKLAHDIGRYPVTELMNRLEAITQSSSFYFNEFSIRGEEVAVYIQDSRVDLVRVINEFEPYFRRVVITEHSDERLTLRLGDINEP